MFCRSKSAGGLAGRGQRGFTLVEIPVVLVILGLLFGLVGPRVIDYLSRAKADVARLQLENIESALDLYRLDVGAYPSQEEGLRALVVAPGGTDRWNGPYLKDKAVPLDPWDRGYIYQVPSLHDGAYDLSSLGQDGLAGGDGEAADITSW